MKISVFKDGYANIHPDAVITDWDEFTDILCDVKPGQKNGAYFVRGECIDRREDENIKSMDLIIIDGDSFIDNGSSCCPVSVAHKVLKSQNITHVVYNSYSNNIVNNIFKWRAVIPCNDLIDHETLEQGVAEIVTIFHNNGLKITNVKENNAISQPWFFPRCPDHLVEDFEAMYHDGDAYRLTGKIINSAKGIGRNETKEGATGHFSWDYVHDSFRAGTLHQGLKSAIGWMVFSTDWADSQIEQMMNTMVSICPDSEKRDRARGGEITKLITYCRGKQGVTEESHTNNWKDHLISASELKNKEFPPLVWAVNDIVPEGLTILAGDPKAGKSLLACDLCSAVANGINAMDKQECIQGDVVYFSMEDPERRVKDRIEKQHDLWPDRFHLITGGITTIGKEFYDNLDEMLLMWPELRMIVVDTLQFIMPQKSKSIDDYTHYYKNLDPLHSWAIKNHVAVVCITHKSKAKAQAGDNPFSGIIGSVAIQGAADAILMLSKNNNAIEKKNGDLYIADGFLHVTGREIEQNNFALEFDSVSLKWFLHSKCTGAEATGNENWLLIASELKKCDRDHEGLSPKSISDATGVKYSTTKTCLGRMKKKSLVHNVSGKWKLIECI